MKYADKHSWVTDWCYKIYIKEKNKTVLVWRKTCYNYGYGFYIILPYSSEHRKIKDIKTFNEIWNKNFTPENKDIQEDLEGYTYDLNHKDFEKYIKERVVQTT